jgi:hypothetical protein
MVELEIIREDQRVGINSEMWVVGRQFLGQERGRQGNLAQLIGGA